ncbi:IS200/IS605 family transposase [Chloroflexi bacterium TSY]|nr:IS200/IS605 family transposase [Chloroflexi bacterium TSY]
MARKYKSNKNIVYSCQYHVVWCPKYRRKVLVDGVDERLKEIILQLSDQLAFDVEEMEVMPDHVHVVIDCDPQFGIYKIVKRIKGTSSRLLRQEFPHLKSRLPTLWTNSACILTTGGATIEIIKKYIRDQKSK